MNVNATADALNATLNATLNTTLNTTLNATVGGFGTAALNDCFSEFPL